MPRVKRSAEWVDKVAARRDEVQSRPEVGFTLDDSFRPQARGPCHMAPREHRPMTAQVSAARVIHSHPRAPAP